MNADDKHGSVLSAALSLDKVSSSELKEVVDMKSANYPHTTQNPNSTNAIVTATVSEPGPTPSGTTGTCYKWHVVKDGEYYYPIKQQEGISMEQLMGWNPSCKADCNNLIQGDA